MSSLLFEAVSAVTVRKLNLYKSKKWPSDLDIEIGIGFLLILSNVDNSIVLSNDKNQL